MNRFKRAWLALTDRLEPEVRTVEVPVVGDACRANLYCVWVPDENSTKMRSLSGGVIWMNQSPRYYETCTQAYAEHPGKSATEVAAIRVGRSYFVGDLQSVVPQPKPKTPKGRARGRN